MLLGVWRRGFSANRFIVARKSRESESAGELSVSSAVEVCTIVEILVGRCRFEFGFVFVRFKLELTGLVIVIAQGNIDILNKPT